MASDTFFWQALGEYEPSVRMNILEEALDQACAHSANLARYIEKAAGIGKNAKDESSSKQAPRNQSLKHLSKWVKDVGK